MPDLWSSRAWTLEERLALAGLGPAWRLARKATGEVACPTCGAVVWARCFGDEGMHADRLFAYAAHLRASTIAPPDAAVVESVGVVARTLRLRVGDEVWQGSLDDAGPACRAAIHHGLVRLATAPERWVLSEYGAACWCQP